MVRRTWDWLAEQPEDAAELAVLLFEAAPKLKISASGSGGASRPPKASRRASYKEEDGSRHRLSAAVPCPTGALPAAFHSTDFTLVYRVNRTAR